MSFRNPSIYDCGIYCITSPSGKKYIGSSNNIPKRWSQHNRELKKGKHHSRPLQNAWNKYEGKLEFKVLLICDSTNLQTYEQQYLDFYKPEYNIAPNAYNNRGIKRTPEFKKRVGEFHKGNKWNLGKHLSPEHREKVRLSLLGNTRAAGKRKPLSEERKKQISKDLIGHPVSAETRKRISETFRLKREAKNALSF